MQKHIISSVKNEINDLLHKLGVHAELYQKGDLLVRSPISGELIAKVPQTRVDHTDDAIEKAHLAFLKWRNIPAPRRGELLRLLGDELRLAKNDLGRLVTLEAGKIISEGLGEVQEMIDICDYAVGLSRQLFGLTIATERFEHRMMETWHPLGVCGVISAFNFPVAVWSWNAALALVCGNSVIWKPSEKTPLTALATQAIVQKALARFGDDAPENLISLLIGERDVGECLVRHPKIAVLSATGSTQMGRAVAPILAARFARSILELGGNNAAIVAPSADLDLTLRSVAFAAMGTAGQRCTSLRRLFVHESIYDAFLQRLKTVYQNVQVGDPRISEHLIGPLIDETAFQNMQIALENSRKLGASIQGGERLSMLLDGFCLDDQGHHATKTITPNEKTAANRAYYVRPALVEMARQEGFMLHETFAPILYVTRYQHLEQAIEWNNAVSAGLSSSIFTLNMREAEHFLACSGSDCGIANVNIGPSGAEIGGAFGGEKETGGGREAGSDSWKAYMRRATNTINYSNTLLLAQGVRFDV